MKEKQAINFTSHWGNKFDNRFFTTIRGQDSFFTQGNIYPVFYIQSGLMKKRHPKGYALIEKIEWKRIRDFTAEEIIEDLGLDVQRDLNDKIDVQELRKRFIEILIKWYQKKGWWMNEETIVQKLYLTKVRKEDEWKSM